MNLTAYQLSSPHPTSAHGHGAPPGPGDGAGHRGLRPVALQRQTSQLREPAVDGQDLHPHGTNFTEAPLPPTNLLTARKSKFFICFLCVQNSLKELFCCSSKYLKNNRINRN